MNPYISESSSNPAQTAAALSVMVNLTTMLSFLPFTGAQLTEAPGRSGQRRTQMAASGHFPVL